MIELVRRDCIMFLKIIGARVRLFDLSFASSFRS